MPRINLKGREQKLGKSFEDSAAFSTSEGQTFIVEYEVLITHERQRVLLRVEWEESKSLCDVTLDKLAVRTRLSDQVNNFLKRGVCNGSRGIRNAVIYRRDIARRMAQVVDKPQLAGLLGNKMNWRYSVTRERGG